MSVWPIIRRFIKSFLNKVDVAWINAVHSGMAWQKPRFSPDAQAYPGYIITMITVWLIIRRMIKRFLNKVNVAWINAVHPGWVWQKPRFSPDAQAYPGYIITMITVWLIIRRFIKSFLNKVNVASKIKAEYKTHKKVVVYNDLMYNTCSSKEDYFTLRKVIFEESHRAQGHGIPSKWIVCFKFILN